MAEKSIDVAGGIHTVGLPRCGGTKFTNPSQGGSEPPARAHNHGAGRFALQAPKGS